VYGNNALLGVINVVTKKGGQLQGAEASVEAGSWDSYKGRFSLGQALTNGVEFLVSGSFYSSAGQESLYFSEFDNPANNNGIARNMDREKQGSLFTSIRYQSLTLEWSFAQRTKQVPTASYDCIFNDSREQTVDMRAYVNMKLEHDFSDDTHFYGKVAYDAYQYHGDYPVDISESGDGSSVVLNKDDVQGEWFSTEAQLRQVIQEKITLTGGVEYRQNLRQFQYNYDEDPYVEHFRDNRAIGILGVYAQGEYSPFTNLVLSVSGRYDYQDNFGDQISPRASAIYSPWKSTTLKLLYGEAFRAPNLYELYYQDVSYFNKANPNLQPETIRSYEVVLEQSLTSHLQASVAGYYYDIDQMIQQLIDPTDGMASFQNLSRVRAVGMELSLAAKLSRGLSLRLSHAVQRAEDADQDTELSNSPRHLSKANLIFPLYRDRLYGGLELQYSSSVLTQNTPATRMSDFWIVNATLFSQKIVKGLELSASLYNLFDADYAYPVGAEHRFQMVQQDGRSFRVKLTYRF
jgi:outer membrane receptor for ferrienterochelin and colicins